MKKFIILLLILLILLSISVYAVFMYRNKSIEIEKINKQYEKYYNIEVLGTELISIINRTVDINNKNNIDKDENGYFIDNNGNTITIFVQFTYKDGTKTIQMEDIEKNGTESFVQVYSTASFKCTSIEYYEKTKNIKSLTFVELTENI